MILSSFAVVRSGFVVCPRADGRAHRLRWSLNASSGPSQSRASAARNCCATCIGAERSRYRTRRRSPGSAVTRPASASRARCLAIACRVIGRRPARSVAVAGPPDASSARMARRLGSARATKTCSAIASMSGGIEVVDQLAQLARPTLSVAVVRLAVGVFRQLSEAGFDHGQPRARTDRLERELDIGAARIVIGQAVDVPGEAEHRRLLDPFDPHVGGVWPPVHVIWADPPGRRSIVAWLPNQLPRPSAVVSAAHTLAGGWAISPTRSIRSGNPMTASNK